MSIAAPGFTCRYEDGVLNVTIQEAAGTDDAWNPNMQSNSVVIESGT